MSANVQWSPDAVAMFDRARQPVRARGWVRVASFAWVVAVLGAVVAAGTAQPPATGTWSATATTILSEGYANDPPGLTVQRLWTIRESCAATCTYTLYQPVEEENGSLVVAHATLSHEADGWHLTWPPRRYFCHGPRILWYQHTAWIMRFTDGGHAAQVHETAFSFAPRCGYGEDSVRWNATWANRFTPTGIMSLAGAPDPVGQP